MNEQLRQVKKLEIDRMNQIAEALWEEQKTEYGLLFAFYEELVIKEYDQIRAFTGKRNHIYTQFEKYGRSAGYGGLEYYRRLRPIWYRAMIREPVKFMERVIDFPSLKLAGVPVTQGVHPQFAAILQRVDKNIAGVLKLLKANAPIPNSSERIMNVVGCFRPDPVADRLSNHMIGAAIDIDSSRNPYLGGSQIRALDKMLEFIADDEAQANPNVTPERLKIEVSWLGELPKFQSFSDVEKARRAYEKTVKISEKTKAFLIEFLDQWDTSQKDRTTPADQRLQKAFVHVEALLKAFPSKDPRKGRLDGLQTIRDQGFISIPAEVFIALDADPDLEWGLWSTLADPIVDVMHFQVTEKMKKKIIGNGYP